MKMITIHVAETVYAQYQAAARRLGRPTAELIREAMDHYRPRLLGTPSDLTTFEPVSMGAPRYPIDLGEELLDEMLGGNDA